MNQKYRIKFSKKGSIKYIGHLDILRYFQKVIRRAEIPVAYSEGFSPHQILSFAFPLSVGFTSDGEYFDVELTEEVNEAELVTVLNQYSIPDIRILKARKLPEKSANCMACVFAAKYEVDILDSVDLPDNYEKKFIDHFSQLTIPVKKPNKKGGGFIDIDLKKYIYEYSIENRKMSFIVNAGSSDNIKPTFVADLFLNELGITDTFCKYHVHRVEIYANKNKNCDDYELVSLMDI